MGTTLKHTAHAPSQYTPPCVRITVSTPIHSCLAFKVSFCMDITELGHTKSWNWYLQEQHCGLTASLLRTIQKVLKIVLTTV